MTTPTQEQAAIEAIVPLVKATNDAYGALQHTRKVCPCCDQSYFPIDTPEWLAYSAANGAERRAICTAVDGGDLSEDTACVRFGMTIGEIRNGIILYGIKRKQETKDGDQSDRREQPEGEDRAVEAPDAPA